jgi:hypothetical protein
MKSVLALTALSAAVTAAVVPVPPNSTPTTVHWGSWGDKCVNGKKVLTAVLYDIPWGKSWEDACANTPAYFLDGDIWSTRMASRCLNPWPHARMFGEWDTQDGC